MILIISGTNRIGSNTLKVAKHYEKQLQEKGENVQLLSLEDLKSIHKEESFIAMEEAFLKPATKFIILSPEYNGSFAGVLKLLIDLSDIKSVWYGKKTALVGVANGRAGNLRGLDNLTNMFHYMKVNVLPNKLPISVVSTLLHEDGTLKDEGTIKAIDTQIEEFLNF